MGLVECTRHGTSGGVWIGKDLFNQLIEHKKPDYLVEILCEYDSNNIYGFYYSPEEADRFGIPIPGVIVKFNMDAEEDPENPFEKAGEYVTLMCSDCFHELCGDLVRELMKKYDEKQYEELLLGFD